MPASAEIRLGVLLFGLTRILGLLAPLGMPQADVPLIVAPR